MPTSEIQLSAARNDSATPPPRDRRAELYRPRIESRVQAVRHKDEHSPLQVLEPAEQSVARLLAQGFTNEQIAARLGFRDKRTISRSTGKSMQCGVWQRAPLTKKSHARARRSSRARTA